MPRFDRTRPACLLVSLFLLLTAALPPLASAETALGDWGHFLSYNPRFHLLNQTGRDFSVTIHVMRWAVPVWNKPTIQAKLTAPDGTVVRDDVLPLKNAAATIEIDNAQAGVYRLETDQGHVWLSSSLDRSVLWTGETDGHAIEGRRAVFQCAVPRRWWFWVPPETTSFVARAQRADRYMSQREDWGFFILSPRGQRIRALWGQPPHTSPREYRQEQVAEVEVEPGAAGRFWAVEVRYGDSHNYSNINLCLEGVPPFIARSPEDWFDPATGRPPNVPRYDETPFIQAGKLKDQLAARWPNLRHFSPCPSLGDPDGIEILGEATFALWNPAGRQLGLRVGTYLPRTLRGEPTMARVKMLANDQTLLDKRLPMEHVHHDNGLPTEQLPPFTGVARCTVSDAERFFAYTYPATPLVLLGGGDSGRTFRLSVGTARNWYFRVPTGTRRFRVMANVAHQTDVLRLAVNAPDRTLAELYGRGGELSIEVPAGLDGKLWHLRPDVGSATRMITREAEGGRYQDMLMTLELDGVPARLAPTWEQWFEPDDVARK